MPYFYSEAEVEVEIDEFVSSCSSYEIKELINCLKEDGYLKDYIKELSKYNPSSLMESEFTDMIFKLNSLYLQMSNDDLQTIKNIVNKY